MFRARMHTLLKFVSNTTILSRLNLLQLDRTALNEILYFLHPFALVPLCSEFLKRKWYAFDGKEMQGAECNALIEHLLRGFFREVKFSSIKINLQWVKRELLDLKERGGCLATFPCIKL